MTKGAEAAAVASVVLLIVRMFNLDIDEKVVSGGVAGAIGLYYSIRNWWKNR